MFVASTVYQQFVAKFKQHVEATLVVSIDTLPEWSKGVDSSSTSASCVGSNPTGVIVETMKAVFGLRKIPPPGLEPGSLG